MSKKFKLQKKFGNEKAQEFASFKLLIEAIFVMAVLAMIIGAYNYLQNFQYQISYRNLEEKIKDAVDTPNGNILTIENLQFAEGTEITSRWVSIKTGLDDACFTFDSERSTIEINQSKTIAYFTKSMSLNVYVQCNYAPPDDCSQGIQCIINLGNVAE